MTRIILSVMLVMLIVGCKSIDDHNDRVQEREGALSVTRSNADYHDSRGNRLEAYFYNANAADQESSSWQQEEVLAQSFSPDEARQVLEREGDKPLEERNQDLIDMARLVIERSGGNFYGGSVGVVTPLSSPDQNGYQMRLRLVNRSEHLQVFQVGTSIYSVEPGTEQTVGIHSGQYRVLIYRADEGVSLAHYDRELTFRGRGRTASLTAE